MQIEFNIGYRKDVEEAITALTAISGVLEYYDWEEEEKATFPEGETHLGEEPAPVKACTCAEARAAEETVLAETIKKPRKSKKPSQADLAVAANLIVPDETLSLDEALAGNFEEVPLLEELPLLEEVPTEQATEAEPIPVSELSEVELQNKLAECVKTVPGGALWFKTVLNKAEKTKLSALTCAEMAAAIEDAEHLISLG